MADYDIIDLLDRLVGFSVELLAADAAGIVLGDARGELRAVVASSEAAELMELLQLQNDEGPCLDCYRDATAVAVADLHEAAHVQLVHTDRHTRSATSRSPTPSRGIASNARVTQPSSAMRAPLRRRGPERAAGQWAFSSMQRSRAQGATGSRPGTG